ncbi:MAG: hypothetical protein R2682_06640 [Pyrinomonadaceae bacterium]
MQNSLPETLERFDAIDPRPQIHELATLAPILKRSDGEIDWNMTASEIANRVRGFQPFPASFTAFRGERLTIWAAEPTLEISSSAPGEIVETTKRIDHCVVRLTDDAGDKRIANAGKETDVEACDLLNGVQIEKGERFSQIQ